MMKYKRKETVRKYADILKEMLEEAGHNLIGLNIDIFVDEYVEKLMKIRNWKR